MSEEKQEWRVYRYAGDAVSVSFAGKPVESRELEWRLNALQSERDGLRAKAERYEVALKQIGKLSNRFKPSRTALHYAGIANDALASLQKESEPPLDEEHEQPICAKCGFEGYAVACVWVGEEGCQLSYQKESAGE